LVRVRATQDLQVPRLFMPCVWGGAVPHCSTLCDVRTCQCLIVPNCRSLVVCRSHVVCRSLVVVACGFRKQNASEGACRMRGDACSFKVATLGRSPFSEPLKFAMYSSLVFSVATCLVCKRNLHTCQCKCVCNRATVHVRPEDCSNVRCVCLCVNRNAVVLYGPSITLCTARKARRAVP